MRAIQKLGEPEELISWKADNAATPENLFYGGGAFPAEAVRRRLLEEQNHLCAYTLRRLKTADACAAEGRDTRAACHIEHLLPQARRVVGEDIDYHNMLACHPPSQSNAACEYGAHKKASFDPDDPERKPGAPRFVSPLGRVVEAHFSFDDNGGVSGLTADGDETVRVLRLDHPALVHDRAAAIRGFLQPKGRKVSATEARRIARKVLEPEGNASLPNFCVAIAEAANRHADREERRAARMKGAQRRQMRR